MSKNETKDSISEARRILSRPAEFLVTSEKFREVLAGLLKEIEQRDELEKARNQAQK